MEFTGHEKSAMDALQAVCENTDAQPYERVQAAEEILKHVRGGEAVVVFRDPVPVRPVQRAEG